MPIKRTFLLFWVLCGVVLNAQEGFILGKLIDVSTREPIAFATIRLKDKAIGVISNQDGGFRIPVEFKEKGDVLEISSMGYASKAWKLSELSEDTINIIALREEALQLEESVVRAKMKRLTATDIVRFAINNIRSNYPLDQFGYIGYYRDYQLKDSQYVNLNEAIIEVQDRGFDAPDTESSEFLMHDYRKNLDFEIDSFAAKPYDYREFDKVVPSATLENYGGNEFIILRVHDAIRNYKIGSYSFINELQKDFIKNHIFQLERKTQYDGRAIYQISIFREDTDFRTQGTIFIDQSNFAIWKLDYAVYKKNRKDKRRMVRQADSYAWSQVPRTAEMEDLLFEVLLEYNNPGKGTGMQLNYISFHNKFVITRPPKFYIENVVLDIAKKQVEIKLNKALANLDELRPRDYKIYYLKKRIDIDSASFHPENKLLVLRVASSDGRKKIIEKLFSKGFDKKKEAFSLKLDKLEDAEANKLGARESENMDQFREFFVQEILPFREEEVSGQFFLQKDKPLHHPEQPLYRSGGIDNYWMNSPLRTTQ